MRIGIIDLGTNSVRFDVHQLGPGKRVRQLHREKIMVRLGQGIFVHGRLDRSAIRRTLAAFLRFKRMGDQFRAQKILAFGTSALREAADRDRFLSLIQEKTGIHVRVISGSEEANLIALGILSREKKRITGRFALVDIGGGSTEISICRGKEVLHSTSFPLGTARLQQLFLQQSPPTPAHFAEMRRVIRNTLLDVMLTERWPKVERVVGSSGTIRTLARILKKSKGKNKDTIDRDKLSALVLKMATMNTGELLGISGMEAKRVDMILGGAVLFEECMAALGAKKAQATELSLRDGLLVEELQLYQQGSSSHLALHLDGLYEKAMHFGGDEKDIRHGVSIAEGLFDSLRRLHKLKPSWKVYLTAAMILRDTGEAINLSRHSEHTYYILKHSDLPAMDEWEIEFVARLCLLHEKPKVDEKDFGFLKSKSRKEAFPKLLAILKLADALDSGPGIRAKVAGTRIARGQVKLSMSGRHLTGLEGLNIAKVSPYFEQVFRRKISAEGP